MSVCRCFGAVLASFVAKVKVRSLRRVRYTLIHVPSTVRVIVLVATMADAPIEDDLEHAQKSPPAEQLAITASLSVDLSQALKWDNSFKDPSLEQRYANSWWFQTRLILHHIRLVAAIQATIILAYIFLVDGGRSFLVTQTTALIQQLLCFCVVFLWGGEIQRTSGGQNTLLAAVFLPLMSTWLLSWMFQQGFAGGGWCHLGSSVDMEIFCRGAQIKKLPQELLCYTFLTTAALIVYTNVSMVLLACYLGAFCVLIVTTAGQAAGSGCILFVGSSVFFVIIAQSQELSFRHRFVADEQLMLHARAIAQYSEAFQAISIHDLSQPCFGLGSGNGGERENRGKRKDKMDDLYTTMPATDLVHLSSSVFDAPGSVGAPVEGAAVKRRKEAGPEPNGIGAILQPLIDTSPEAIVVVNRTTAHFEMQNSIFVQMVDPEDSVNFHELLKAHLCHLFACNPGAFNASYPTTIGHTSLNICASCVESSELVMVRIQDISIMMRQQQNLRMMIDHMVELAQRVQTPERAFGNVFRSTSDRSLPDDLHFADNVFATDEKGVASDAPSSSESSIKVSDDTRSSSDLLDLMDLGSFMAGIQEQQQECENSADIKIQVQSTSVVKKKTKRRTEPKKNKVQTENKVKTARKPYRFCVSCWIMKGEWIIKALTTPDGCNVQVGGHTQMR